MIGIFDQPRAFKALLTNKGETSSRFKPSPPKKINQQLHSRGIDVRVYTHHFWVMWGLYPLWFLGYVGHYLPPFGFTRKKSTTNTSIAPSVFNSNRMALASGHWGWKRWVSLRPRPPGRCYVSFGEFFVFFFALGARGGWPWRCCFFKTILIVWKVWGVFLISDSWLVFQLKTIHTFIKQWMYVWKKNLRKREKKTNSAWL